MCRSRASSIVSLFAIVVTWCTGHGYSFQSPFLFRSRHLGMTYSRSHIISNSKTGPESTLAATGLSENSIVKTLGGKMVVAGIDGSDDEDEFMLNLLNEQVVFFYYMVSSLHQVRFDVTPATGDLGFCDNSNI